MIAALRAAPFSLAKTILPLAPRSRQAGETYTQHNPRVADGTEGFIAFVRGLLTSFPDIKLMIKHVIPEGDLVVTHAHLVKIPGDPGLPRVDIFTIQHHNRVD